MHRLLVSSELLTCESPTLPKAAERHLKVLRPEIGETIELFDGQGWVRKYVVEISGSERGGLLSDGCDDLRAGGCDDLRAGGCDDLRAGGCDGLRADGVEDARQGSGARKFNLVACGAAEQFERALIPLTLFACVTKGSRWDWTIEKATELGVSRIVPVISDRTIVRIPQDERAAKRERWQRIAEDAARQSDAKWLPVIEAAVDFQGSLKLVAETDCFVGALTDPAPPMLVTAAREKLGEMQAQKSLSKVVAGGGEADSGNGCGIAGGGVAVYVGPEGDFTPAELAALLKIATPTSFGASVLRAETAAIYAVSVLQAVIGEVKSEKWKSESEKF